MSFAPGEGRAIFVGSTRDLDPQGDPTGWDRAPLSLARYDVAVPPTHTAGEITYGPDPAKDFVVTQKRHYDGDAAFQSDLRHALAAAPASSSGS